MQIQSILGPTIFRSDFGLSKVIVLHRPALLNAEYAELIPSPRPTPRPNSSTQFHTSNDGGAIQVGYHDLCNPRTTLLPQWECR